jgi:UDP-glucose 4-epimerase
MDLERNKILVTGATGLVGSHVIDRLMTEYPKENRNFPSFGDNHSPDFDDSHLKPLSGTITRTGDVKETLNGIDFVIHAASLLMREGAEDPRAVFNVNVNGTFNLLEGGVASKVKRFIYSSSISVYGDPLASPMIEDHPFNITLMYGASKVSSELFLKIFKRAKGLDDVALRYASVNGPRQRYRGNLVRYVRKFFDRIERGPPPIICGDGSGP